MAPKPKDCCSGRGYGDLGKVRQSPLDSNDYRVIQLCSNGLKALVVSTCDHPLKIGKNDIDQETCIFNKLRKFNTKFIGIGSLPDASSGTGTSSVPSTSTDKPERSANHEPKTPHTKSKDNKKVVCNKGLSDPDDAGQDNRNNIVAVALTIGSGILDDPPDVPGMAHFVEHCVFLGSKKFPDLEGFQTFIQDNDGDVNAGTDAESTAYKFTVGADKIKQALEMFSDLIVNPNFDSQRVANEINAMNSEFFMNKLKDDFRFMLMIQSLTSEGHPLNNFNIGSQETLSQVKDLKKRVEKWKNHFYVASKMVFAIQGPMPLDDLCELVVKYCGNFPVCHCPPPPPKRLQITSNYLPPMDPDKWNKLYNIVPVFDDKWIRMSWVLPREAASEHRTKPNQFLSYLFTRKAEGSLDYFLRSNGWLLSICCTCPNWKYLTTSFCTLYVLTLQLTGEGLKNKVLVIKSVFSYIDMLKNSSTKDLQRTFTEIQQISADLFHFRSDTNITDPVNDFSYDPFTNADVLKDFSESILDGVCPTEVLTAKLVTREFNEMLIRKCIQAMTPRKTNFMVATFANHSQCNREEQSFKTKFSICKIKDFFLNDLENVRRCNKFYFPPPNNFIETSMCYPVNSDEKLEFKDDFVIMKNEKLTIDYSNKDCRKGYLPSAYYEVFISSKKFTHGDVVPILAVWIRCLSYMLDIKFAQALSSLINYNITYDKEDETLGVFLAGPSQQLPELFEVLINTINNFENEVTQNIFENMTKAQIRAYNNTSIDAETFAADLAQRVLEIRSTMTMEYSAFLNNTSFTRFIEIIEDIKERMFVTLHLVGCISKSQADKACKTIRQLEYLPFAAESVFDEENRALKLPLGERCLRVKSRTECDNNNMILNHYQTCPLTPKDQIIVTTISQRMYTLCFEQLRTQEHLAYFVDVTADNYHSVSGISVSVRPEADKFSPDYVDERIDTFIEHFYKEIILKKDNYKQHIDEFFDAKDKIYQSDVKKLYETYFLPSGSGYRKLSVQVVGSKTGETVTPKPGKKVSMKIKKYANGIPRATPRLSSDADNKRRPFVLDLPEDATEENGYFITDICSFQQKQPCFQNLSRLYSTSE